LNFFLNTILSAFSMPSLGYHHKLSDRNLEAKKAEPLLTMPFPTELGGFPHPPPEGALKGGCIDMSGINRPLERQMIHQIQ
jgi:hypothetical protein